MFFFGPKCNWSVASKNPKLDAPFKYLLRFQRVSSGARNIWWPMLTHFSSDYVNDTGFLPPETDSPRNSSSMLAGLFFPTRQTVANWTKWKTNYPLQRNKTLPVTVGSGGPTECQTRPALALMCCFGSFGGGVSFSACVLVAVCRSADAADRPTHRRPVKKKNSLLREFQILIKHTPIDSYWGVVHFLFWLGLDATKRSATNLRKLTRATALFIVSAGLCGWPLSRIGLDPKDLR